MWSHPMARLVHYCSRSRIGLNAVATTRGYIVKSLIRAAVLTTLGLGAVALTNSASAVTLLSFGVTGVGSYTVNTGNITAATATKTIPTTELIGGTTTPTAFADAGLTTGGAATFSQFTFGTTVGPIAPFTLAAGTL